LPGGGGDFGNQWNHIPRQIMEATLIDQKPVLKSAGVTGSSAASAKTRNHNLTIQ
jgi:hypothetical protein